MKLEIGFRSLSTHSLAQIESYIKDGDFYLLNRSISADYKIIVENCNAIEDEDSVLIMLSSILICLFKISTNDICALQLSDSPPTVVFRPVGVDYILVQLDSYGTSLGEELSAKSDVVALLESTATLCRRWLQELEQNFPIAIVELLNQMYPTYPDIARFLPPMSKA